MPHVVPARERDALRQKCIDGGGRGRREGGRRHPVLFTTLSPPQTGAAHGAFGTTLSAREIIPNAKTVLPD